MKSFRVFFISLFVLCLPLTACQGKDPNDTSGMSNAEISEKAMENFLSKLEKGNYTMETAGYGTANVYSKDLVWIDYTDEQYNDFAVMSVKGETFQAKIEGDGLGETSYYGEGQAIDAASPKLLNQWLDESVSNGNIYNLFYNDPENPLLFSSHEAVTKQSLLKIAGYPDMALNYMEDVYLELDNMDPATAHVKAVVNDDVVGRHFYDDIDITVTFGKAEDNAAAEAWMKNPEYPAARASWDDTDLFILNSVFLYPWGDTAVPFPKFASYALKMDGENFIAEDAAIMRDPHATEQDMKDYIDLLKQEGFEEATETDADGNERTVYRRMLREDFKCYTSVDVSYNNGVDIVARKSYDYPEYKGLGAINDKIASLGYTELPDTMKFKAIKATDHANELTESWLYFFTYDSVLYVEIDFDDRAEMEAYLKDYQDKLKEDGFRAPGTGALEEKAELARFLHDETEVYKKKGLYAFFGNEEPEENEYDYLESENGFINFRYQFIDEDTVDLLFKAEKYISSDEAETILSEAGFPAVDLHEPMNSRDLRLFRKVRNDQDFKLFLTVDQNFDSAAEAEAFLTAYEEKLTNAGFGRMSPDEAGTLKNIAIVNEEKGMMMALDFFEQNGGALICFEFVAE